MHIHCLKNARTDLCLPGCRRWWWASLWHKICSPRNYSWFVQHREAGRHQADCSSYNMECDLSVLNKKIKILFICSARFASNYMEKCVVQKMIRYAFSQHRYLPTRHCWTLSKSASHLRISTGGTLVSRSGLHSLDIQGSLTPFFEQQSYNKNNYWKL